MPVSHLSNQLPLLKLPPKLSSSHPRTNYHIQFTLHHSPFTRLFNCFTAGGVSELTALKCLSELPVSRRNIVGGESSAVAGGDLEGEALAVEVRVALPVLAPIS